jgi:hypothetical protein
MLMHEVPLNSSLGAEAALSAVCIAPAVFSPATGIDAPPFGALSTLGETLCDAAAPLAPSEIIVDIVSDRPAASSLLL